LVIKWALAAEKERGHGEGGKAKGRSGSNGSRAMAAA